MIVKEHAGFVSGNLIRVVSAGSGGTDCFAVGDRARLMYYDTERTLWMANFNKGNSRVWGAGRWYVKDATGAQAVLGTHHSAIELITDAGTEAAPIPGPVRAPAPLSADTFSLFMGRANAPDEDEEEEEEEEDESYDDDDEPCQCEACRRDRGEID